MDARWLRCDLSGAKQNTATKPETGRRLASFDFSRAIAKNLLKLNSPRPQRSENEAARLHAAPIHTFHVIHKHSICTMAEPSDEDLMLLMKKMVKEVDLNNTGVKKFTKLMSKELGGIDLSTRKAFIKKTLEEIINSMDDGSEEEEEEESESEEEEEEQPKKKKQKSSGGGGGGGGLTAVKNISPELAAFFGRGNQMSRTEIVKLLWEYIREHDLQNPENKREILLDEEMKKVFGDRKSVV